MSLDSFVVRTKPAIKPICTSRSIQDRDSTFIAHIFKSSSLEQAYEAQKHVKLVLNANNPASHNMMACRFMALKKGRTGVQGPDDFEMRSNLYSSSDDMRQQSNLYVRSF